MAQVLEITETMDGATHVPMLAGRLCTNTSPHDVMDVFTMAGFDSILTIE